MKLNQTYMLNSNEVDLTQYDESTPYIAPYDGLAVIMVNGGARGYVYIDKHCMSSFSDTTISDWGRQSVFIKKGCKIYGAKTGNGYVVFRPYKPELE